MKWFSAKIYEMIGFKSISLIMLLLCLVYGIFLRIQCVYSIMETPELNLLLPEYDDFNDLVMAKNLGSSEPLAIKKTGYPAYVLFIHLILKAFSGSIYAIYWVQLFLSLLSVVLLVLLGLRIFNLTSGLATGVLYILCLPGLVYDVQLQNTCLSQFLLVLSLYAFYTSWEVKSTWKSLCLYAVSGTCLCLLRPFFWPLVSIGFVYLIIQKAKTHGRGALNRSVLAGMLLMIPCFFLAYTLKPASGYPNKLWLHAYLGNHAQSPGYLVPLDDIPPTAYGHFKEGILRGHAAFPGRPEAYWQDKVLTWIKNNPWQWCKLELHKIKLIFNRYEIHNATSVYYYEEKTFLKHFPTVTFDVIVALFFGSWIFVRRKARPVLPLLIMFIYSLISMLGVFICTRYRMPLYPVMCLFAGAGVSGLFQAAFHRQYLKFSMALVLMAIFFVWSNSSIPGLDKNKDLHYWHKVEQRKIQREKAIQHALAQLEQWENLDQMTRINLTLHLGRLHLYHEFFSVLPVAKSLVKQDSRTFDRLLKQEALTLEAILQFSKALHVWKRIPPDSKIYKEAAQKIKELEILSLYEAE